jgi:CRP-like cAMP-binding protein
MVLTAPTPTTTAQPKQQLFSRQEQIGLAADILWRIESGAVRTLTWDEDGTVMVLGYWGAGDVLEQCLSRVMPYQIECLTSVQAIALPKAQWQEQLDAVVAHTQQAEKFLCIAHQKPVAQRLWQFLLFLSQKFGCEIDAGILIDLPVTHQEMAEAINVTRVTVTSMLQQLEREGKLRRHLRKLIVYD